MSSRRRRIIVVGTALTLGLWLMVVVPANLLGVTYPLYRDLRQDDRNAPIQLVAYFGWTVNPTTVSLDLWSTHGVSVADLGRVLLRTASTLSQAPISPRRVNLNRHGRTVYYIDGETFLNLGYAYRLNSKGAIGLIFDLVESLRLPDGTPVTGPLDRDGLYAIAESMRRVPDVMGAWVGVPVGDP